MAVKVFLALGLFMIFLKSEALPLNLDPFGIDEFKGIGRLEPMTKDQQRIRLEVKLGSPFPSNVVGNVMKGNFAYADGKIWYYPFPEPFVLDIGYFLGEMGMAFKGSAVGFIESKNTFSFVTYIKLEKMPFKNIDQQIKKMEFNFHYANHKLTIEEDKKDDDNHTGWGRTGL